MEGSVGPPGMNMEGNLLAPVALFFQDADAYTRYAFGTLFNLYPFIEAKVAETNRFMELFSPPPAGFAVNGNLMQTMRTNQAQLRNLLLRIDEAIIQVNDVRFLVFFDRFDTDVPFPVRDNWDPAVMLFELDEWATQVIKKVDTLKEVPRNVRNRVDMLQKSRENALEDLQALHIPDEEGLENFEMMMWHLEEMEAPIMSLEDALSRVHSTAVEVKQGLCALIRMDDLPWEDDDLSDVTPLSPRLPEPRRL